MWIVVRWSVVLLCGVVGVAWCGVWCVSFRRNIPDCPTSLSYKIAFAKVCYESAWRGVCIRICGNNPTSHLTKSIPEGRGGFVIYIIHYNSVNNFGGRGNGKGIEYCLMRFCAGVQCFIIVLCPFCLNGSGDLFIKFITVTILINKVGGCSVTFVLLALGRLNDWLDVQGLIPWYLLSGQVTNLRQAPTWVTVPLMVPKGAFPCPFPVFKPWVRGTKPLKRVKAPTRSSSPVSYALCGQVTDYFQHLWARAGLLEPTPTKPGYSQL